MHAPDALAKEYESTVPDEFRVLLERRDGAAQLVAELPKAISPAEAASPGTRQRAWELCGLYYCNLGRWHEALAVFHSLYDHMLAFQQEAKRYAHKGMPLVYLSDCYDQLDCMVLAKRYLMLTACEDAIRDKGRIPPETTGLYFRMVWKYGVPHAEVERYASKIWELSQQHTEEALFPEWLVQELDQDWMVEYPSFREAALYVVTARYVRWLLDRLGGGDGKALERLGHYLLSSIPGCRAYKRRRSHSTDYDIVCALEGVDIDFRSDLGRYFLCECKDWQVPADFSAFAKFCRVLDSVKCRFGILFSRRGISGTGQATDAEREQLKVFQDRGIVVAVISEFDLERVAAGANLIAMLRSKYEIVRLDLGM